MKLKEWMKLATRTEQEQLAELVGTSVGYLRQIASGRRNGSACFALAVRTYSKAMSYSSKGRLKEIEQGDVCDACAKCPFYLNSKK
ncbi:helix-turn-helix transcriptional regulator [Candidatus Pacearchaeota archaeon]|nr:helix-turn-helix transcriptional regulator [Candidatus Pacearchaeota archaeon]